MRGYFCVYVKHLDREKIQDIMEEIMMTGHLNLSRALYGAKIYLPHPDIPYHLLQRIGIRQGRDAVAHQRPVFPLPNQIDFRIKDSPCAKNRF